MISLETVLEEVCPWEAGSARQVWFDKLEAYATLIQRWNKVYNLTAITEFEEIIYKHFLDSLLLLPFLNEERIIDVGSGAGFPGIPLALSCPSKRFALLDSNSKKTRFLIHAISELGITNTEVIHSRVENYHPIEKWDIVVTRAFAQLTDIARQTRHLLNSDGKIIAMKGKLDDTEIQNLGADFFVEKIERLDIKTRHAAQLGARHILLIRPVKGK